MASAAPKRSVPLPPLHRPHALGGQRLCTALPVPSLPLPLPFLPSLTQAQPLASLEPQARGIAERARWVRDHGLD